MSTASGWKRARFGPLPSTSRVLLAAVGAYAVYFIVLVVLMPGNPDHNDVPIGLLREFRIFSVEGAVRFWTLFGLLLVEALDRLDR